MMKQKKQGVNNYIVTLLSDTFITSCIWSLRLLYLTKEQIEDIGGPERHMQLWTQFVHLTLDYKLFDKFGGIPMHVKQKEDTIFSLGLLCSHVL